MKLISTQWFQFATLSSSHLSSTLVLGLKTLLYNSSFSVAFVSKALLRQRMITVHNIYCLAKADNDHRSLSNCMLRELMADTWSNSWKPIEHAQKPGLWVSHFTSQRASSPKSSFTSSFAVRLNVRWSSFQVGCLLKLCCWDPLHLNIRRFVDPW